MLTTERYMLRLWYFMLVYMVANCQYNTPISPCPKIFTYENDGQQWYGKIKIQSPPYGSEMKLRVMMSLGAHLPTKYSGSIELIGERGVILNNILRGHPISYKINFPLLHPLPKVTQITFNGRQVCSGPRETFGNGVQTVTDISLDHTLQTGNGGQRPIYDYNPEPTYNYDERPNPETFARPQPSRPRPRPSQEETHYTVVQPEQQYDYKPQKPAYSSDYDYNRQKPSYGIDFDDDINKFIGSLYNQQGNQIPQQHTEAPRPQQPPKRPHTTTTPSWHYEPETEAAPPPRRKIEQDFETDNKIRRKRSSFDNDAVDSFLNNWVNVQYDNNERKQPNLPNWMTVAQQTQPTYHQSSHQTSHAYRPTFATNNVKDDEAITGFLNGLTINQGFVIKPDTHYVTDYNTPWTEPNRPTYQPQRIQEFIEDPRPNKLQSVPFRPSAPSFSAPSEPSEPSDSFECGVAPINTLFVKGNETRKGDWPWLVAMYVKKPSGLDFTCAGTLVSQRHIITAAHCVNGKNNRALTIHDVILKVGVFNLQDEWTDDSVRQLGVSKIIAHPKYTGGLSHLDDIAIFVSVKKVEYTHYIKPACLWTMNPNLQDVVGKKGTVVGWGRDENGLTATPEPREGKVPIVSTQTCRASLAQFARLTSDTTLCAGSRDGTGPCNGDSGGGMYLNVNSIWYLRAIVSLSLPGEDMPCNLNEYVVYTDTAQYLPWIREIMAEDP